MRSAALIAAAMAVLLAGCGDPKPPTGKWQGVLDTPDTIIAARVEIDTDGKTRVSAPHLTHIQTTDPSARNGMRLRVADELAEGWRTVEPRDFTFDGETFRKPDGVAPQMEWDGSSGRMTVVVYFGRDPARRVRLDPVREFSSDPFVR